MGCENVIEFLKDEERATVTFSQGRFKTRIRELQRKWPNEVCDVEEGEDGTLVAHVPTNWIKINPPRQVTLDDLQKEKQNERLAKARTKKNI